MIENFKQNNDPLVHETSKITEIRDNFGKVRYKIYIIDKYDYYEESECQDIRYEVSVYSLCYSADPYIILKEEYGTGEEEVRAAWAAYDKYVQNYKYIVQVETKDYQDIMLYAERINYAKIDPDCCLNCKYSKICAADKDCLPNVPPHMRNSRKRRLLCMNADIFKDQPLVEEQRIKDIQPKVDDYGHCDLYERRQTTI